MAAYIQCKACGYIMNEAQLKDFCPACGLAKMVFEPYKKVISPLRKFILDQHLHPITVHFPQVLLLLCLVMPLLSLIASPALQVEFLIIAKWSILALPFTVLGGLVTGLIDGKLRFKKVTTPLLVRKIIAGILFQILSISMFILYITFGLAGNVFWLIVGLSMVATGIAIYLGKAGAPMFDSVLPG